MNKALKVGAAIVVAIALTGCGKALKEENARLTEQVTLMTEQNSSLTGEKGSLEAQVAELSAKVTGLEAENGQLKEQLAAKIKARPGPAKKKG